MSEVRLEWGLEGLRGLRATASGCAVVIVDVFSFTTCVTIAAERGATVCPSSAAPAPRSREHVSLSPQSIMRLEAGADIVLPSRNGSTIALAAAEIASSVWAASLRNATAIARRLANEAAPITIIAAGERWPDDSIRFALEDLLGAGAVIAALPHPRSPEAAAAVAAFEAARGSLAATLAACTSGREMLSRGFAGDVTLAAAYDVSSVVPQLRQLRGRSFSFQFLHSL